MAAIHEIVFSYDNNIMVIDSHRQPPVCDGSSAFIQLSINFAVSCKKCHVVLLTDLDFTHFQH